MLFLLAYLCCCVIAFGVITKMSPDAPKLLYALFAVCACVWPAMIVFTALTILMYELFRLGQWLAKYIEMGLEFIC